jgi:hypothetical protein
MSSTSLGLTEAERYIFDVRGYLVLRGVLSKEEVGSAVSAISKHKEEFVERHAQIKNAKQAAFNGTSDGGRLEHGKFLQWPKEDSQVFRSLLAHPKVAPKVGG